MRSDHSTTRKQSHRQMYQPLESRRLMSLTAGFDFAPPGPPPGGLAEIVHSFGFERSPLGAAPADFNPADITPPLGPPGPMFGQNLPDPNSLETQLAHAIAHNTSITITPSQATATNTLSSLYSSLETSTVIQIDSATSTLSAAAMTDVLHGANTAAISPQTTSGTVSQVASAEGTLTTHDTAGVTPIVTSDKALSQALSVLAPPLGTAPIEPSSAPSWASLRKLEDELSAVKTVADQVVMELGRDSAIALSHLESIVESVDLTRFTCALCGWRSGMAITGAAIAAVALAQHEAGSTKEKPVFSNRLIQEF